MITLSLSRSLHLHVQLELEYKMRTGIRPSVGPFSCNNRTEIRTNDRRVKVTGVSFEECCEQRILS